MNRAIAIIFLVFLSSSAFAVDDFKCTVKEVYKLEKTGLLEPGEGFVTPDIGSQFVVNRQSGQITGKKITNTMSGVIPTVYSHLPTENSYIALTIYKPNYTVDLLQINEYVETDEKPFLYKGAFGEVVTGVCTVE